jgi:peptidoglycan/xylan/chitin deacetylase (PgdA/CDA1 family)
LPVFAESYAAGGRPRRIFAITFDDGYRDNLLNAAPELERTDLPATIFVVSGAVAARRDFWWDALARVFLTQPRLPPELRLRIGQTTHVWRLAEEAEVGTEALRRISAWRVDEAPATHERQKLFLTIWGLLITRPFAETEELCSEILAWARLDRAGPPDDQTLSADEIASLAGGGLFDIGGHTKTHQPLNELAPSAAWAEIDGCRAELSEIVGRDIRTFSYPFGRLRRETPNLVRQSGFACACTNRMRLVYPGADRFRLPRVGVPDLDGEEFERFLEEFVG